MSRKKILYVVHTHPAIRPGGAEVYALRLYDAMRSSPDYEPIVLTRNGPPQTMAYGHPDAPITMIVDDPDQSSLETDARNYDWFFGTLPEKPVLTKHYRDYLLMHKPEIVHFHHTLYMGWDMVRLTRSVLPDAAIVFTLHEYLAICHRDGQMVRTTGDELCSESSPRRCHECFPDIPPREFLLRTLFIQSHLSEVDLFVSPSRFLRDRYIDWGIPPDRIVWEDNGAPPLELDEAPSNGAVERSGPTRLGFFGQFSHYKGVNVLLAAMQILAARDPSVHLWLHGANLDMQPQDFQDDFNALVDGAQNVTLVGRYRPEEIATLMAGIDYVVLPSLWWENAPLVIPEAFGMGRPVICSGIGGMAEKVEHGVSGLHFRVNDPLSLAEAILEASKPGTWERLHAGIPALHSMDEHVRNLTRLYDEALNWRHARTAKALEPDGEPVG